jgi:Zn-dependent protease
MRPPGQMPPESFNRLLLIGGIIIFLFVLSLAMQGTGTMAATLIKTLVMVPVILISLTLHELAHALMADFLGDPTPRRMGRITLNPLRHLDPVGAIVLFFTGFGWAKPVMVDARNFRVPGRAMAVVALVGPLSNFSLAALGMLLMKLLAASATWLSLGPTTVILVKSILEIFIVINIGLALFNLLPVPPLDGSRILSYLLPPKYRTQYHSFENIAPFILLILFAIGGLGLILSPLVKSTYSFLDQLSGSPAREILNYLSSFSRGTLSL